MNCNDFLDSFVNGHHLILGELRDFVTGKTLPDTHDERYRQKLARFLLEQRGFARQEIKPRRFIRLNIDGREEPAVVDLAVEIEGRCGLIVKYGPGSLVTRHRPALAASRLLVPYQIPWVVVTNGEDADVLDGASGDLLGSGMAAIPHREKVFQKLEAIEFRPIPEKRRQGEARILYCFDIDGRCPCDGPLCEI
jgi:hypothetical protein